MTRHRGTGLPAATPARNPAPGARNGTGEISVDGVIEQVQVQTSRRRAAIAQRIATWPGRIRDSPRCSAPTPTAWSC